MAIYDIQKKTPKGNGVYVKEKEKITTMALLAAKCAGEKIKRRSVAPTENGKKAGKEKRHEV